MYTLNEYLPIFVGDGLPEKGWDDGMYCLEAEHHDIPFYASALHITPVYLSRVVRQATGRTVVDYINQMLLMEASFLLQTSGLSITQIADHLHFADTPSFSKFFSRLKGVSPKEYRKG